MQAESVAEDKFGQLPRENGRKGNGKRAHFSDTEILKATSTQRRVLGQKGSHDFKEVRRRDKRSSLQGCLCNMRFRGTDCKEALENRDGETLLMSAHASRGGSEEERETIRKCHE